VNPASIPGTPQDVLVMSAGQVRVSAETACGLVKSRTKRFRGNVVTVVTRTMTIWVSALTAASEDIAYGSHRHWRIIADLAASVIIAGTLKAVVPGKV
jgi:hypothetical protein